MNQTAYYTTIIGGLSFFFVAMMLLLQARRMRKLEATVAYLKWYIKNRIGDRHDGTNIDTADRAESSPRKPAAQEAPCGREQDTPRGEARSHRDRHRAQRVVPARVEKVYEAGD